MLHLRFNFITDSSGDPSRMTRPEVNTNGEPVSMISTRSYSMIGEVIYLFTQILLHKDLQFNLIMSREHSLNG